MTERLRWGILATGSMADTFARALAASEHNELVAVASRSRDKAMAFGRAHGLNPDDCHEGYQALLEDASVQAVHVATPHTLHMKLAIAAITSGKHVLCEKPMALDRSEAATVIDAAGRHGVFLSEGFMYRWHPQTHRLVELIRTGAVGTVRMIRATFGFVGDMEKEPAVFDRALAGGAILDVGGYPASMVRLLAGAALNQTLAEPVHVQAMGHLGRTGVDEWTVCHCRFEQEILAELAVAVRVPLGHQVQVLGSHGTLSLANPWLYDRDAAETGVIVHEPLNQPALHIQVPAKQTSYALQADGIAQAIAAGRLEPDAPAMTWQDTLGNMALLDQWRSAIGMTYD